MKVTHETLTLLVFLIPGIMSSVLLNTLVVRRQTGVFARIAEALIFSVSIYVIASPVAPEIPVSLTQLPDGSAVTYRFSVVPHALLIDMILALALPVMVAISIKKKLHMRVFRWVGATDLTGGDNTWNDVFVDKNYYIIVNLTDGTRIFGWPEYSSHDPAEGLIYLQDPAWINADGDYEDLGADGILLVNKENLDSIVFTGLSAKDAKPRADIQNPAEGGANE